MQINVINNNEGPCLVNALHLFNKQYMYSSSSTVVPSDSIVACLKGMTLYSDRYSISN